MTAGTDSENSAGNPTDGLLEQWRAERRSAEAAASADWRSAIPAALFERLQANRERATASPDPDSDGPGAVPLPATYRAPYLPSESALAAETSPAQSAWEALQSFPELLPEEPASAIPHAFAGLDWISAKDANRVVVSVRPILDPALADEVVRLLDATPGMSGVRALGASGEIAAFEAEYDGDLPRMAVVSEALRGIGASLVSTGDREFYLAIQGHFV